MNQQLIPMFQKRFYLLTMLIMFCIICTAQRIPGSRFDFSLGYGVAGSFFVRSYDESVIYADDIKMYKKDFIGSNRSLDLGLNFKRGYSLRLGLNRQQFSKEIEYVGYLDQWQIELDRRIYHVDNIFSLSLDKRFIINNPKGKSSRHALIPGIGIYYIRSYQNEIDILYSLRIYRDVERNYNNSGLEEAGAFIHAGYEYLFQPKMRIGINGRFNYTISTGEPESISLTPFVRFLF